MTREEITNKIKEMMTSNDQEMTMDNFIDNCVAYALRNNHTKTNWIARELFDCNLSENELKELFDED